VTSHYVYCSECHEKHDTRDVEFVDISEGDQGQDVMRFVCPVTKIEKESNVYRGYCDRLGDSK